MGNIPELQHLTARGIRLGYREAGEGPALVFIHGMGGDSRNWESQYARFSGRYRVIGWDAPGYGGSEDWPGEAPAVRDYSDMIARFLDGLGVDRAHMVGHSFGGTLMPAFQKAHPKMVASMVLAQPVIGSGPRGRAKQAEIVAARLELLTEKGIAGYAREHAPNSVAATADAATVARGIEVTSRTRLQGYMAQWQAMARADIFKEIGNALPPTTVVAGAGDRTASQAVVRRIADALPGARFVTLPEVGHMIYIEHPERFDAALEVHLGRL